MSQAEAEEIRQRTYDRRSESGNSAAEVVAQTHRCCADLGWKNFRGDGGETGEEPSPKERENRPERKKPQRVVNPAVNRRENRRNEQVPEIGPPPPEEVRGKTKKRVTEPFANSSHDQPGHRFREAQSASSIGDGQGKIRRHPDEQSPIAKHPAGIHRRGEDAGPANVLGPEAA